MKRGIVFLLIITSFLFVFSYSSYAYQVADNFVFPVNGYTKNDGCLEWEKLNDQFKKYDISIRFFYSLKPIYKWLETIPPKEEVSFEEVVIVCLKIK